MAERKPRTRSTARASETTAPAEESKAQAEFARYKERVEGAAAGASFASPLPRGAVPAWSLQPSLVAAGPPGAGPAVWVPEPPGAGAPPPIAQGLGTTIRLGVDVLNATLSSSLRLLSGVGETVGVFAWPGTSAACGCGSCDCGSCGCGSCDCCGPACDCCCVLECGCGGRGCCEPSVGTCC